MVNNRKIIEWYVKWFDKKTKKLVETNVVETRKIARRLKREMTQPTEYAKIIRREFTLVKESVVR